MITQSCGSKNNSLGYFHTVIHESRFLKNSALICARFLQLIHKLMKQRDPYLSHTDDPFVKNCGKQSVSHLSCQQTRFLFNIYFWTKLGKLQQIGTTKMLTYTLNHNCYRTDVNEIILSRYGSAPSQSLRFFAYRTLSS